MEFSFSARGDSNISSEHRTTLEVTRQGFVSKRGDCIIAVSAEVGASGLPHWLKDHLRSRGRIRVRIEADGIYDEFECSGHEHMTFEDERDIVFRKSSFVCGRTVGILCSKSAADLNRALVERLERSGAQVKITISTI